MTSQFSIVYTPQGRQLRVEGALPDGLHGEKIEGGYLCPTDESNAAAIRQILTWSAPQRVGLKKSVGLGDRLGIATPGHLRAVREGDMFPVLVQQSMREMERARRSARRVLDDVTWGVIEANYQEGYACDADHLKTTADIDICADAGYLGYTLDPGQYVDDAADTAEKAELVAKIAALDWEYLQSTPEAHHALYQGHDEMEYLRALAKYGGAIAHVAKLNNHLIQRLGNGNFDLEVSVDETASVTTIFQHKFIVLELKRLLIDFIGIAPRFPGDFEKGVDYIGDLAVFEAAYEQHAQLARDLGGYKLSIHSGSDKFSVYPIIAKHSGEKVHLKTSGTSWVEALRVIASKNPDLFKKLLDLAIEGYPQNRASYHVSGKVENIPQVPDSELPTLLDHFDAREVLHVSFGPALAHFYEEIYAVLNANLETYWQMLHTHFNRHIQPFKK